MKRDQGLSGRSYYAFRITAIVVLLTVPVFTPAGDTLYGPKSDGNNAYLRVLNALESAESVEASVGSVRFGQVELVSPYKPISAGIYVLTAGDHQVELIARRSEYLTAVVRADGIEVESDIRHNDPARAQLVLYNYGLDGSVSLRTADNGAMVIDPVSMGESRAIAVNAVPVVLAVAAGKEQFTALENLQLERGQSYSVFVLPPGEKPRVEWTTAKVAFE